MVAVQTEFNCRAACFRRNTIDKQHEVANFTGITQSDESFSYSRYPPDRFLDLTAVLVPAALAAAMRKVCPHGRALRMTSALRRSRRDLLHIWQTWQAASAGAQQARRQVSTNAVQTAEEYGASKIQVRHAISHAACTPLPRFPFR